MSPELTAGEVLEIAEMIEREAAAFYRGAAAATSGDERRQLLELAEMEDEHVQVFHGLRIRSAQESPAVPDPAARKGMPFLASVIAGNIKEDLAETFAAPRGRADLLERALGFEKDTVVFYTSVKEMLPEPADKKVVDKIILEELRHVLTLTTGSVTPGQVH